MIPALPMSVPVCDWTAVLDALPEPGYVVLPGFLPMALVAALRSELQALDAQQEFHAAGIGRGSVHQLARQIRGDRIAWLRQDWPAAACYLAVMEDLRQTLNRHCFLGLAEYEAHYACYEAGSAYRRHVDRHADERAYEGRSALGQRVISTVFYLNEPCWPSDAGGELMLYPQAAEALSVVPEAGTLVIFLSDNLPHEVLAATRVRLSIAGWMRTRD